jgi:hypothetical protein
MRHSLVSLLLLTAAPASAAILVIDTGSDAALSACTAAPAD